MTEAVESTDKQKATDLVGFEEFGSGDDLRLVLDAIAETSLAIAEESDVPSLFIGQMPMEDAEGVFESVFGCPPPAEATIAAFVSERSSLVVLEFDMTRIRAMIRPLIASGISNSPEIAAFIGHLPIDVSDRIDAARSDPRLAGHFISTAADHLAETVRHRLQETLMPISFNGDTLCWTAVFDRHHTPAFTGLGMVFPFVSRVLIVIGSERR